MKMVQRPMQYNFMIRCLADYIHYSEGVYSTPLDYEYEMEEV